MGDPFPVVPIISPFPTASSHVESTYALARISVVVSVYINGTMPMYTIDYIFAYGDGLKAEKFDIITSQKALNSSDHCPLILDFEIK